MPISALVRTGLLSFLVVLAACGGPAASDGGTDAPPGADSRSDGMLDVPSNDAADVNTGPGPFGAPCTQDTQCESGICLSGGHCSRTCTSAADCPASPNWHCTGLPGRGTVCDCTPSGSQDLPCNNIDDDCNGQIDEGSRNCNGACVDVLSNAANCGACGIACGGGTTCRNGHCDCPTDHPDICGTRCVATATDPMNCGRCGNACPAGTNATASCNAGTCALGCNPGFGDCDGNAGNGCETDTRTNTANCGSCGHQCTYANASAVCSTGSCVMGPCVSGYANCNGDPSDGCETDPATSVANCGGCGRSCAPAHGTGTCAAGSCELAACDAGYANCDTLATNGCEATLATDPRNCGTCGHVCPGSGAPNMVASCSASVCSTACAPGYADCDGIAVNGCEVNLGIDPSHCGSCSNVCSVGQTCTSGACGILCPPGTSPCGTSCFNLNIDPNNCGACGVACASPRVCSGGTCACASGLTFCGGNCVSTSTDPNNCGACGVPCPSPRVCSGGACSCAAGLTFCGGNCVSTSTDPNNCGACGVTCAVGQTCTAGTCTTATCVSTGNACTYATDCCTSGTSCRPRPSTYACCFESGHSCTSNTQCCGQMTCTGTGGTCACRSAGQTCVANADCCSGSLCQSGVCTTGGTCTTVGNACSFTSQCCTGMTCTGSVCTRPYCAGRGAQCGTGYACCSGLMCSTGGTCVIPGSCGATGATCSSNGDCCSGFCFGTCF